MVIFTEAAEFLEAATMTTSATPSTASVALRAHTLGVERKEPGPRDVGVFTILLHL